MLLRYFFFFFHKRNLISNISCAHQSVLICFIYIIFAIYDTENTMFLSSVSFHIIITFSGSLIPIELRCVTFFLACAHPAFKNILDIYHDGVFTNKPMRICNILCTCCRALHHHNHSRRRRYFAHPVMTQKLFLRSILVIYTLFATKWVVCRIYLPHTKIGKKNVHGKRNDEAIIHNLVSLCTANRKELYWGKIPSHSRNAWKKKRVKNEQYSNFTSTPTQSIRSTSSLQLPFLYTHIGTRTRLYVILLLQLFY